MAQIRDGSSEEEVLYEGQEKKESKPQGQEVELGLDEITRGGSQKNYLNISQGKEVVMTVEKVRKVKENKKYALSNSSDEEGDPYKIEVVDPDGDVLSVNVWQLWGKIKQAYREAKENQLLNSPEGLNLKISHPGRGKYEVYWSVGNSNWKEIKDK